MFGTHIVVGDDQGAGHGLKAGTRVRLIEDDGSTWKLWADESGESYWIADEDLEPA